MIAACSTIIAINIYEIKQSGQKVNEFFKNCKIIESKYELQLDFWNCKKIHSLTDYSIVDLKECLYDLCDFMIEDLLPNRLEQFTIQSILNSKIYHTKT